MRKTLPKSSLPHWVWSTSTLNWLLTKKHIKKKTWCGTAVAEAWACHTCSALRTWLKRYRQTQDMKCVCSLRSAFGIQSTSAHPRRPSRGQMVSPPSGSGPIQKGSFICSNEGSGVDVRVWASNSNSGDSKYLMLTPALELCCARMSDSLQRISSVRTPSRSSREISLLTTSARSSQSSLYNVSYILSLAAFRLACLRDRRSVKDRVT
mmetsp:Transcript_35779/g.82589  ORF Transcript_35779/g.82589 Transcript_35779/m.82589 type:complete len:208 (-) Transcript_35779:1912-2535(-)